MKSDKFYSSALNDYIRDHIDEYKAFIAMSSDYVTFYYTALYAGRKTIAIPTMHNMGISFRSVLTSAFSNIAYVGFNTGEEQRLAENILGLSLIHIFLLSVLVGRLLLCRCRSYCQPATSLNGWRRCCGDMKPRILRTLN